MNKTRALATAGIVAGMAALTLGALASPASAHTPDYGKDCHGYHVSLTNYGEGSTRKLVVDGTTIASGGFSGSYTKNAGWDATKSHTIGLDVHSSDGPSGDVNWHVTQAPCEVASTTAVVTTVAPTTTVAATVVPTTVAPSQATTTAPTTAPPTTTASSSPTSGPNVPTTLQQAPPSTVHNQLPATGGGDNAPVEIALGAALVLSGIVLVLTRRRDPNPV
jgi:LPXTG-motif cell wall-anchored protein